MSPEPLPLEEKDNVSCWKGVTGDQFWPRAASVVGNRALWYLMGNMEAHVGLLIGYAAQMSWLNKHEYEKLSDTCSGKGPTLQKVTYSLSAANGDTRHVFEQVTLWLVWSRIDYQCTFVVVKMGNLPRTFGLIILTENETTLDCAAGAVKLSCPNQLFKDGNVLVRRAPHVGHINDPQTRLGPWNQGQLVLQLLETGDLDAHQGGLITQVTNPRDCDVWLSAGMSLADARVEVMLDLPAGSSDEGKDTVKTVALQAELPGHLLGMINRIESLSDRQLLILLVPYQLCCERNGDGPGRANLAIRETETGDGRPVKISSKRESWVRREALDVEVDEMLMQSVIEYSWIPSSSFEWDDVLLNGMCSLQATPQDLTWLTPNWLMIWESILKEANSMCEDKVAKLQVRHCNRLFQDSSVKVSTWVLCPILARRKLLEFRNSPQVKELRCSEVNSENMTGKSVGSVVCINHWKIFQCEDTNSKAATVPVSVAPSVDPLMDGDLKGSSAERGGRLCALCLLNPDAASFN